MNQATISKHPNLEHVLEHALLKLFNKYKSDCNVFLETGLDQGHSIYRALVLGFEKVLSIDCKEELVSSAMQEYSDEIDSGQVFVYNGFSNKRLSEMLDNISDDDRCFFWLDAHTMAGAHTVSEENEVPIFQELELLQKRGRKNDVIVIDDVALFYHDKVQDLVNALYSINSEYNIVFDDCCDRGPYMLIATTEKV
tara:strand:- start:52 stop:639 length:588 start_codon:yes stop_codon:yes gene_type:complete